MFTTVQNYFVAISKELILKVFLIADLMEQPDMLKSNIRRVCNRHEDVTGHLAQINLFDWIDKVQAAPITPDRNCYKKKKHFLCQR